MKRERSRGQKWGKMGAGYTQLKVWQLSMDLTEQVIARLVLLSMRFMG